MSRSSGKNTSLQVKRLIEEQSEITYDADPRLTQIFVNLIVLQVEHTPLESIPDLSAPLEEIGEFLNNFHGPCNNVMHNYNTQDYFMLGGEEPNIKSFRSLMFDENQNLHDGVTDFLQFMVTQWVESANQYQTNRIESAKKQLANEGVDDAEITALIADPIKLRNYIHEQRQNLVKKLTDIQKKKEANSAFNMMTKSESVLWEKHVKWFPSGASDVADYYPNDGAVHYPLLIMELAQLVQAAEKLTVEDTIIAVYQIIKIMHSALSVQGARDAWKALAGCPSFEVAGVDIGELVANYVTDDDRNIEEGAQLSSPFGRSPMRLYRIACNFLGMSGPFSLLNAPPNEFFPAAVDMYHKELDIKKLSKQAKFIKGGTEAFYISISCAWLKALEREWLAYVVTGRNDLSVPKLVGGIVDIKVAGFDDLKPRDWALAHDITGRNDKAKPISENYVLDTASDDEEVDEDDDEDSGKEDSTVATVDKEPEKDDPPKPKSLSEPPKVKDNPIVDSEKLEKILSGGYTPDPNVKSQYDTPSDKHLKMRSASSSGKASGKGPKPGRGKDQKK